MPTFGVAITVPQPWAGRLTATRHRVGDPMAAAIPPHVTLMPPTLIEGDVAEDFRAHLDQVAARHAPFTMMLGGAASFRPVSPVVFVQVSEGISSCEQLERDVRSGPVRRVLDFHYHPHVTIAHNVDDEALDRAAADCAAFRAEFPVSTIDLYEQGEDLVWRPRRPFVLRGSRPERR